ncbi:MAG: hypothetical protein HQL20_10685 [Candidatus Omnitrophica bacterium]|nr:hypothetical protein [Candidatus Omnitrophota bacterium]
MKILRVVLLTGLMACSLLPCVMAQQTAVAASVAANALGDTRLCPLAVQAVEAAEKLSASPVRQESYLVAQAKEFMAARQYQPAYDLANYILASHPQSVGGQEMLVESKIALEKLATEHIAQAQAKIAADVQPSVLQTIEARKIVSQVEAAAK